MSQQVVLTKQPVTTVGRALTPQEMARIRARLSQAIQSFWSSPEGQMLKAELSETARNLGWDEAMKTIMRPLADEIRTEADRIGLGEAYRRIWGK